MTNKIITVGIIGSRERDSQADYLILVNRFERITMMLSEKYNNLVIRLVSGGCRLGADFFAEQIAKNLGLSITIHYPAKHTLSSDLSREEYKRKYAQICFERNTLIAQDSDILIAMLSQKSNGTKDTISKYERLKGKKAIIL